MICFSSGNYLWIVGHPNSLRWLFDACILKVFILLVNMMICKLCVCAYRYTVGIRVCRRHDSI